MKILWITNIPSPYRVAFFNELGKHTELTVLCENRGENDRDLSWLNFDATHFKIAFISEGADLYSYIDAQFDYSVVTNYYTSIGMRAILRYKRKKKPYIIEGDGAFAGSGKGFKENLKKWLIRDARFVFSTSAEHDNFYKTYGITDDKIVRYPFSSIAQCDVLKQPIDYREKLKLRKELNMQEEKIILSVGQFIPRKGYDVLIKAMPLLNGKNIGCYIVGGKPSQEYFELLDKYKVADKVHFIDFKLKDELNKYYMAADLFVLPTREDIWGLVVNEAMAKGLPVVTTTRCIAGLELITESSLGKIIEPGNEEKLAAAICETINVSDEQKRQVLDRISQYTIENMSKVHLDVFDARMSKKKD